MLPFCHIWCLNFTCLTVYMQIWLLYFSLLNTFKYVPLTFADCYNTANFCICHMRVSLGRSFYVDPQGSLDTGCCSPRPLKCRHLDVIRHMFTSKLSWSVFENGFYKSSPMKINAICTGICILVCEHVHAPDAFYAWDSSPHLLVTPVQLMRPGIGQNTSCAVGDFL